MDYVGEARKIANRSSFQNYKTGAIILQGDRILSNGWSHTAEFSRLRSMHAEIHALGRARHLPLKHMPGLEIHVVTVNQNGNLVSGKPCLSCAVALRSAGVTQVYYSVSNVAMALMDLRSDAHFTELKVYPQDPLDE